MILKIVIASLVIYVIYKLYQKYKIERFESNNITNQNLLDTCKTKCNDNYKRCLQNHCKDVVASNNRRIRMEVMDKVSDKEKKRQRDCVSKCDSIKKDDDKRLCTVKCFNGNDKLNEKMRNCYRRCGEDHKNQLDYDDCISRCYTKEINMDREMGKAQQQLLSGSDDIEKQALEFEKKRLELNQKISRYEAKIKELGGTVEGFENQQKGANLDIAITPVLSPEKSDTTLNFDEFSKYVSSKELYKPPEVVLRKLYRKINNNNQHIEQGVYEGYKSYLNDISIDFKEFDAFVQINSLRVLSFDDRKQLFKHLDKSGSGYITYSSLVKGVNRAPINYSFESFVNIMKIYIKRLGMINEYDNIHYRRLFELGKIPDKKPTRLIENMTGNVVDATRKLNDKSARMNPLRMFDMAADADDTGTRNFLYSSEMDILLNPIIRDLNKNRVNKLLKRVLNETNTQINDDMNACRAVGRERIDIAPIVSDSDVDVIVSRVRNKMIKCQPPIKVNENNNSNNNGNSNNISAKANEYENTEKLINSIGKDLINSGLFKNYVESKCGFFCPANDKKVPDDKDLILPRDTRTGTVFDIWNPPSVNVKTTASKSISGRDFSKRESNFWKQVPRKVLDKICSDNNCVVKPHND